LQSVGIKERRTRIESGDAGAFEQFYVDAVQAGDFLVLGGDQSFPIMHRRHAAPAEAGSIPRPGTVFGRLHHHFFRHAADINASAAPMLRLGDRDARAVARRDARAANAAAAAADDKQIEIEHETLP
jgi:hypothetical protein